MLVTQRQLSRIAGPTAWRRRVVGRRVDRLAVGGSMLSAVGPADAGQPSSRRISLGDCRDAARAESFPRGTGSPKSATSTPGPIFARRSDLAAGRFGRALEPENPPMSFASACAAVEDGVYRSSCPIGPRRLSLRRAAPTMRKSISKLAPTGARLVHGSVHQSNSSPFIWHKCRPENTRIYGKCDADCPAVL